jgi:hypothetical protein
MAQLAPELDRVAAALVAVAERTARRIASTVAVHAARGDAQQADDDAEVPSAAWSSPVPEPRGHLGLYQRVLDALRWTALALL